MKTITSPINGQQIPVTLDLNIKPLTYEGKPLLNGRNEIVTNDKWIYVNIKGYGIKAINVYRAHYCEKMYMSQVPILDSIGNKKVTKDLQKFLNSVSDKLVFQKYGKWYRVFLERVTNQTYGIKKVVPYNWTINPNMKVGNLNAFDCCLDWKSKFYIN